MLAVQDFCCAAQKGEETVADFIHQLERFFRVAYGHGKLGQEAQEMKGLKMELMNLPSVSGAVVLKQLLG